VFGNATTYTCLLFLTRAGTDSVRYVRAVPSAAALGGLPEPRTAALGAGTWLFLDDDVSEITDRLVLDSTALLDLPTSISRGSSTGDDMSSASRSAMAALRPVRELRRCRDRSAQETAVGDGLHTLRA